MSDSNQSCNYEEKIQSGDLKADHNSGEGVDDASGPLSFPRFADLPRDIRYLIYDLLLPGPRIVHIQMQKVRVGTVERVWNNQDINEEGNFFAQAHVREACEELDQRIPEHYGPQQFHAVCATNDPLPGIFFAFRDAHEFFRRLYSQTFSMVGSLPTVWFSSQLDTLYLNTDISGYFQNYERYADFVQLDVTADFSMVRRLALAANGKSSIPGDAYSTIFSLAKWSKWFVKAVSWFENLDHITLIVDEFREEYEPSLSGSDLIFIEDQLRFRMTGWGYSPDLEVAMFTEESKYIPGAKKLALKDIVTTALRNNNHGTNLEVDYKVMATARRKQFYEKWLRNFWEGKDHYRRTVSLNTPWPDGEQDLSFSVDETTTVRQLLEQYRVAKGLEVNTQQLILYRGSRHHGYDSYEPDRLVYDITAAAHTFLVSTEYGMSWRSK